MNSTTCIIHRNSGRYTTALLTLLLVFSGCMSSRPLPVEEYPEAPSAEMLMENLITRQVSADWFSAKAKINYSDDYQSFAATSTIHMRKDSLIWMNFKKLGIEVSRVQITRDSIFAIDRINNQYIAGDIKYVEDHYNLPASLTSMQTLLLGNPLFLMTSKLKAETKGLRHHLFGIKDHLESHYWLNRADFSIEEMNFKDYRADRNVNLTFEEYGQMADNQNFSYFRNLELKSRETGNLSIRIRFSKVEINIPKSIRFEIPERYTRFE